MNDFWPINEGLYDHVYVCEGLYGHVYVRGGYMAIYMWVRGYMAMYMCVRGYMAMCMYVRGRRRIYYFFPNSKSTKETRGPRVPKQGVFVFICGLFIF